MNLPDFTTGTPLAVAIDLDETTLDSNFQLAGRTRRALHAVYDAGLPIVIATSRPERVLSVLVGDDILEITSLVQMNGTIATGRAGLSGSFRLPLDPDDARLCWDITNELAPWVRMSMEIDGTRFAVNHVTEIDSTWAFSKVTPTRVMSIEEAMRLEPVKVSVNGLNRNLEHLANELDARLSGRTVVLRTSNTQYLNVVPKRATKSGALVALLDPVNISLDDVLAFGDDHVDIDLIRDCGWSVAVDNAVHEIKSLARYGTASNDDHGVAIVLERLVAAFL